MERVRTPRVTRNGERLRASWIWGIIVFGPPVVAASSYRATQSRSILRTWVIYRRDDRTDPLNASDRRTDTPKSACRFWHSSCRSSPTQQCSVIPSRRLTHSLDAAIRATRVPCKSLRDLVRALRRVCPLTHPDVDASAICVCNARTAYCRDPAHGTPHRVPDAHTTCPCPQVRRRAGDHFFSALLLLWVGRAEFRTPPAQRPAIVALAPRRRPRS
ncbi:hypothetical protein BC834DRAFT_497980 [Gloeopeniophorella convolvens]|nr:hypothetical protein BC834DRAFT_497980 [Gloeopeniophorella convolvens]